MGKLLWGPAGDILIRRKRISSVIICPRAHFSWGRDFNVTLASSIRRTYVSHPLTVRAATTDHIRQRCSCILHERDIYTTSTQSQLTVVSLYSRPWRLTVNYSVLSTYRCCWIEYVFSAHFGRWRRCCGHDVSIHAQHGDRVDVARTVDDDVINDVTSVWRHHVVAASCRVRLRGGAEEAGGASAADQPLRDVTAQQPLSASALSTIHEVGVAYCAAFVLSTFLQVATAL